MQPTLPASTDRVSRLSLPGLALGLLFVAASLTPSLIPRGPVMQGVLGGVVLALGYLGGRIVEGLWSLAEMPVLRGRARRIFALALLAALVALLAAALIYSHLWQEDLRARMGMEPVSEARIVTILALTLAVFAVLYGIGRAILAFYRLVRRSLARVMPARRADVLGGLLVLVVLIVVTRDGILDRVLSGLDTSFEAAQNLFDTAPPAPTDPRKAGGPGSLIDWQRMGQPGRDFVMTGPDAETIAAFTGRPALQPIRVYVGRANAETPEARADLALAELIRLDAFRRKVLVVVSPTGTGWMDPGAFDPLDIMHGGDVATVSVQYSYLNSPLALIFETETGLDQAGATLARIHDYWKTLPRDARPRLYVHGLSLGAWSSMHATNLFRLIDDPIDGAFWVGPPFPSDFWNRVQRSRNPGSPWVRPQIGTGNFIRYAGRGEDGSSGASDWGDMRIMFLQYPSDPIVFYDPLSVWKRPVWMQEAPGDGVSPYLRFMPVVTQFQLALDMALSTSVPGGYGHAYHAPDYIGPWVQVTRPEGWTADDTTRLIALCDSGFGKGCARP
ncbi:alpha/beta hydrolase [Rhodobacter calidifons]|uniref:Alpha/beta-hydrolase family protein n=1 Tax=Rhodobacter calidifons TaxID=2715277 RepID=A0ABX0G8J8_9RHOB|nr:alpha/beta-hydrolase family protein [Rhodobacter calidifons]NHB77026.1 hypothetical protein [Rhodobacter calidifons]